MTGPVSSPVGGTIGLRHPVPVVDPSRPIIVTIDGPAGTGKSSVAREVARLLGLDFLDTGAMYRAAAAIAIDAGIPIDDVDRLVEKVVSADLHFDWSTDPPAMLAWDEPIDHRIRDADVTAFVSPVSAIRQLREHMVRKQRIIWNQHPRLVSEGRDQGSIVFPNADVKFYLDASAEVRATRRLEQLRTMGTEADFATLRDEIIARDQSDSTRKDGPLVCPDDAVRVDTSDMSFDEVVRELERQVRERVSADL